MGSIDRSNENSTRDVPRVGQGKMIGAISCSGGTGSQDEVLCKAGAAVPGCGGGPAPSTARARRLAARKSVCGGSLVRYELSAIFRRGATIGPTLRIATRQAT